MVKTNFGTTKKNQRWAICSEGLLIRDNKELIVYKHWHNFCVQHIYILKNTMLAINNNISAKSFFQSKDYGCTKCIYKQQDGITQIAYAFL